MKRLLVTLLMLVLYLTGCVTWRPVTASTASPRQLIEEERPGLVRIVLVDGTQQVLRQPHVESDSVIAVVRSRSLSTGLESMDTVRIALTDVAAVETQSFSAGRTVLAVVMVPVGFMAVVFGSCIFGVTDCN